MAGIFISYRRKESKPHARLIFQDLRKRFRGRVFMDVDGLKPGEQFRDKIGRQLDGCTVLLALMGPQWAQVRDPKRRSAPFRDRVVHHALFAVIGPIFEHDVLKRDLRRRIACERTLALCDTIIDGSNAQEPAEWFFPGDDLFSVAERHRGLPLGNLTSQFFANVYLDGFDHRATEVLRAPYLRYVDDFALFADDPAQLEDWRIRIDTYLCGRRLRLHPDKTTVIPTAQPPPQARERQPLPSAPRWAAP